MTTLGTDPELFIFDHALNRMASAPRVIGAYKDNPVSLDRGVKMYADNALAEASMPPEETVGGMVNRIRDVIMQMSGRIGKDFSLVAQSSHFFHKEELGEEKLWEVGCNPNFNAYLRCQNEPIPFTDTMRTGSFHLHLGHDALAYRGSGKYTQTEDLQTNPNKVLAIKLLDIYLGCASVLFDKDQTSGARRKYYGMAGEFRPTPYGVEYRVLGNWALRSPETTRLCFDLALRALDALDSDIADVIVESIGEEDPQLAINSGDVEMASEVLLKTDLEDKLHMRVFEDYKNDNMMEAWA